jgi:SAM-dependent methyltransferase
MGANASYEYEGAEMLQLAGILPNYNRSIALMACRYGAGAQSVLDFGAGTGVLSQAVRELGLTPLCLEPDARQRDGLVRQGFATISSLDEVADASLDFIYSSNVLEHIEDDVAALADLRRKLRPGGRLLLYVPAFQSLYSSMDRAVGHYRRYDRLMLGEKLRTAGFAVEDLYYADVLGYFVTRLYMRIGNDTTKINPFTLGIYDRFIFPVSSFLEKLGRLPVGKNIVGIARKS